MSKLTLIILLLSVALLPSALSQSKKLVIFSFYVPYRTMYPVAISNITASSPTSFGLVCVVNYPLIVGPNDDSAIIGQAQGIIAYADLAVPAIHASITFFFTGGEYNGSSFNMVGRYRLFEERSIVPIIGGTGAFELAQEILMIRTNSSDPKVGRRATFQYNVTIAADFDAGAGDGGVL